MKNKNFVLLAVLLIITSSIVVYSADAAGIPKKAISTVARFLESDLPTTTVFTDIANTFGSGQKQTFTSSSTTAGLNIASSGSDPSSLADGDVWLNGATLKYRGSGITNSLVTSAITSINSDVTAAQLIQGTTGNTTVSTSSGTTTVNTGTNVVVTGGSAQTISKSVTFGNTVTIKGLGTSQSTKTSSTYTMSATDTTIFADASSNSVTITLPSPSTASGQIFLIKRIDSSITNTVTIQAPSGYIDESGQTTRTLDHRQQSVVVQSDGTNYHVVAKYSYSVYGYYPKGSTLNRFVSSPNTGLATSTGSLVASTMYAMPFVVEETSTYDTAQIKVSTKVTGSTARIGIYQDTGNTYPGSIVADLGTISTAAIAVVPTTASPLPVTLKPGLYWLVVSDTGAPTIQTFAVGGLIPILGIDSAMGTAWGVGWSITTASSGYTCCTNALPSPFPASGATVMTASPLPMIVLRASS